MKTVAILIIALICTVSSFQMSKKLNSLNNLSYGSLFAEIRAQIKAGGPLANVEGLLDELVDEINAEQARHAAMLARNQASCEAESVFRSGEVQEAKNALERATLHLAACSSSFEKTNVDIDNTKQDIVDTQASLDVARAQRAAGHAVYLTRVENHRAALAVVNGAFALLDDFVTEDASLIQLSKHTTKMAKSSFKINQAAAMAPVIAMFAQMATSEFDMFLDEASVERIRAAIQAVHDSMSASLDEYEAEERAAQSAFDDLEAKLMQSLRDLNDQLVRMTDHAEEMAQCMLEENVIMSSSEAKISRNTNLLALSVSMCASFEEEFHQATAGRNEELELLAVVRKMVQKRLGNLGGTIAARDDEFDHTPVTSYAGSSFEHEGGDRDDALEGYGL